MTPFLASLLCLLGSRKGKELGSKLWSTATYSAGILFILRCPSKQVHFDRLYVLDLAEALFSKMWARPGSIYFSCGRLQ